jgi:hypothetical protein
MFKEMVAERLPAGSVLHAGQVAKTEPGLPLDD